MSMKELKVEELEENIEELKEVVEAVSPVIVGAAVISVALLFLFLLRLYIQWHVECPSKNRMDGKTVLITGGNTGLGKATATELAKRGARVILGCRDKNKGEAVARQIRKKTRNQNVFAHVLDLASLRSIQEFVYDFNSKEDLLHVVINNAAYMGPKAATKDGLERTFGVNYLGHFYLTYLLKDKLKKCAPSRIINVASDAYLQGNLDLEDIAMNKGYDIYSAYSRSKFAQVLFTQEAHRRFFSEVVISLAVHPGCVCTDLLRNWPGIYGNVLRAISRILFKSPEEGCQTIVYCAVVDGITNFSGKLFVNCKAMRPKDKARDKEMSRKLWNLSLSLCGLDSEIDHFEEEEAVAAETTPAPVIEEKKEPPKEPPKEVKKEQPKEVQKVEVKVAPKPAPAPAPAEKPANQEPPVPEEHLKSL